MFPYRFPAAPTAAPTAPAAPTQTIVPPRRRRPLGAAALAALALFGGAIGGGAAGAAMRLVDPSAVITSGSALGQPLAGAPAQMLATTAAPAAPVNVAGAVFAKINPAVVQVVVSGTVRSSSSSGSGSGVVIDREPSGRGRILTNNHVVERARAVSVRFADGTTREARVLGTDRGNDLALLQVDLPPGAAVAPLGDSDKVAVGETAIAIGSPFGLEGTVTQGIVSAVQRTWVPGSGRARRGLIQTDAPINPGNSGGPLLNAAGEVIGINTMIESPVRGSVGVGFAVPINIAKRVMAQLEAGARLEPVWLGISGQDLDATIARDQGLPVQSGVLLIGVVPDSPAARAGLHGGQGAGERIPRGGDVISAVDGQPVENIRQLTEALAGKKPGDTVQLAIVRDGATQTVAVQLQAWPESQE